jgi:FkbM family methyltransferase
VWSRTTTILTAGRDRLLPAAGARLSRRPRAAETVLRLLRRLPGRRLRSAAIRHVSTPLVYGMTARLELPVVEGSRMLVETTDVTGRMLATSGVWEPHVTAVFRGLLAPGDVCVDVGANVGYFTLLASRLVGPAGRVYAFEPAPLAYAALAANLGRNDAVNVTAERVAVGAEEGTAVLHEATEGSNRGASSLRRVPEASLGARERVDVSVDVRPLAALLRDGDLPRLRLVKIDVEGYEGEVLRGLDPIFERGFRPAVIVEVHAGLAPETVDAVADFWTRHGLRARRVLDREAVDRAWASRHVALVELESGEALAAIPDPLIDVLLTAPSDLP